MNTKIQPQNKKINRDSLLVEATNRAVDQRRKELEDRKLELITFKDIVLDDNGKFKTQRKTYSQLCPHEVIELAKIETELQIIENLMIKTQHIFQKMGGQIKVEIRRSDVPDEYYESLNEVEN